MDRFFHVTEKGSTIRTEIMAGITTFMAMAYILMVNAGMFSNPFGDGTDVLGVSYGAIYVATAISAVVGTLLIGLLSNLPLAQASGMGLNAYFVYTVCVGLGLSYANALVLVLFDGIIFVLLTVTGLRKIIFDSIPHEVKVAISAGIGLFIAFIGLQNAGIVVNDASTCVNLHSFNVFTGEQTWATIFPMLITLIAVFAIGAMSKKKVRGAVLWGILGAAVPNMDRAMLADACATCAGAVCGTSTVTTFVESSAGVAEGGRTGLASMATAVMFFIAMFLSPVAQLIPTYACAAALIYVGVLMMSNVRNINWDDPAAAVTGFVTVAFMPLTYNISYGIAFGLISYVFVKIFTGRIKDINVGTWIISILFALMFFLTR